MINKMKKIFILVLSILPCAAFADLTSYVHYFTPPATDYSMTTLNTVFGAMGNVLQGRGNQLLGIAMGIFNACWIVAIGIGILYVIWDSVMHAAQSGEMMMGRGKKTVFKIIGITIGFSLAIPSGTTGYSLAQSGAMWLVVQGVGMADRISTAMYKYFQSGGLAVTAQPATGADISPLMSPASGMLKSQICMFKLESILSKDKKAQDDANKTVQEIMDTTLPSYSYNTSPAPAGYSINSDNTITVGTYADDETFKKTGHRYNSECGTISWTYSSNAFLQRTKGNGSYTPSQEQAERTQTLALMTSGVTQMFTSMEPVARQIALIDPNATDSAQQFYTISSSGASALANSGIGFATLLDPLRRESQINSKDELAQTMANYNAKGWVFTPLMIIVPGLIQNQFIPLTNYAPSITEADVSQLTQISDKDKAEIAQLMAQVDTDQYAMKSLQYLDLYDAANYSKGINFDFSSVVDAYKSDKVNNITDYLNAMLFMDKSTLGVAHGILDWDIGSVGGSQVGLISSMGLLFRGLGEVLSFFHANTAANALFAVTDTFNAISDGAIAGIESAQKALDDMVKGMGDEIMYAKNGGLNNDLLELTKQIGPVGPILATLMTSMIGKGMASLDMYAFNGNLNAMESSINIGGDMIVASLEATFSAGHVLFVTTMVNSAVQGLSGLMEGIPFIGGFMKGVGAVTDLSNKGVDAMVPLYIMLALFFFGGGLMLFILVPLSWVLLFGAVVLRWIGMVLVSMIAAPIFCFNLIRTDGEGIIGRGERFLVDLLRAVITPAILTLGAVVFMVMFNVAFQLVSLILTNFLPLIFKVHGSAYLVAVSLAAILMLFGVLMVYVVEVLASMCTSDLVQAVGSSIGEALHHAQGAHGLHDQLKSGVSKAGGQASNPINEIAKTAGGMKK